MERSEIISLIKKNIPLENLEKAKKILNTDYEISYGDYEEKDLKKAIQEKNPVVIENHLLIGFNNKEFIDSDENKFSIERMVKAIVIEGLKEQENEPIRRNGDPFAIIGRMDWMDSPINLSQFHSIMDQLQVGEVFLPPHSAVFNFLNPTEKQEKEKIVSMLVGANINIFNHSNYIDNCFHEIGHLFWRTSILSEEKEKFKELFKKLNPASIYEYEWERKDAEEMFCTIYKWYLKSILINKSFYNILEYEEPTGLLLFQNVLTRIANDKMISDIWESNKQNIFEYLNPRFDKTTGKYLRKAGMLEKIQDIEIPRKICNDIVKFEDGIKFVDLGKAIIPVKDNKIIFESMEKATPYSKREKIFFDCDGVVADFVKGYKDYFLRDAYQDDNFTITQQCMTMPNFFRVLPVKEKGKELFDLLKDDYIIIFLTTPMSGMDDCKRDKIEWIARNFGSHYTIIFSDNKADYVVDLKSILIDDWKENLQAWADAGGTALNFNQKNDAIIDKIKEVFDEEKQVRKVAKQLEEMEINTAPTEEQKKIGNYKKGEINFKGLKIKIENPRGSVRWGLGNDGLKWFQKMKSHYGYILHDGESGDGEKIDVFVGPKLNASRAFVVNQKNPMTGQFDENKVMLGFDSIDEAEQAYMDNYKKGWEGLDSIKQTNTKGIRLWLSEGNFNEPF